MSDQNPEDTSQSHVSVKDLKSRFEANKKNNKQPEFVPGKSVAHSGEKKLANATWIKNKQEKEEQEEEPQQESHQQVEKPKEENNDFDVKNAIARFNKLSKKEDTFEDLRNRKEQAKAKALMKQKEGHHDDTHEAGEHNEHNEHHEHHEHQEKHEDEDSRSNRVPSEKFDTHVRDKIQFFSKGKVEEHQTHIPKWRVGPSGEQIAIDEHGNDIHEHGHQQNDEHNEENGEQIAGVNVQEKIKIYSHDGVELEEEHARERNEIEAGDENGRNREEEKIAEGIVQEKVEYFSNRTPEEEELERRKERREHGHAEEYERGDNEVNEENREVQNLEAHYVENFEKNETQNKLEGQNFVEKEQGNELEDVDVQEKIELYSRTQAPDELPAKKKKSKKNKGEAHKAENQEEAEGGNNESEEQVEEKEVEVEQIEETSYQSQEAAVIESQENQEEQAQATEIAENYQPEKGDVQEKIKAFSHENKEQTQPKKKHKKGKKAENKVANNEEEVEKEEERAIEQLEEQVQEVVAELKEQEQQLQEEQIIVENEVAQEEQGETYEEESAIQKGNTQDKIKMFSNQENKETYQPKKKHHKKHNKASEGERKDSTNSRENEDEAAVEEEAERQQNEEYNAYKQVEEEARRVELEARKQEELQIQEQEQAVQREIEAAEGEARRIEKAETEKGDVQGKIKMFSNNDTKETYQPKKKHNKKKHHQQSETATEEQIQIEEGEIVEANEEGAAENYENEGQGETEQIVVEENQENIEAENAESGYNEEIAGIEKGSVKQRIGQYSHENKPDTFTSGRKHHHGKTQDNEGETNEEAHVVTEEEAVVEQNTAEENTAQDAVEENKEAEVIGSKGSKKKNKKKQNKNKNKESSVENQASEEGQVVSDEVVPEEPSNEPEAVVVEETNQTESDGNVQRIIESGVYAHQTTHHHHHHHDSVPEQTENVSAPVEESNVETAIEQQEQLKEEEVVQNIPQENQPSESAHSHHHHHHHHTHHEEGEAIEAREEAAQEVVEVVKEEEQPAVQENYASQVVQEENYVPQEAVQEEVQMDISPEKQVEENEQENESNVAYYASIPQERQENPDETNQENEQVVEQVEQPAAQAEQPSESVETQNVESQYEEANKSAHHGHHHGAHHHSHHHHAAEANQEEEAQVQEQEQIIEEVNNATEVNNEEVVAPQESYENYASQPQEIHSENHYVSEPQEVYNQETRDQEQIPPEYNAISDVIQKEAEIVAREAEVVAQEAEIVAREAENMDHNTTHHHHHHHHTSEQNYTETYSEPNYTSTYVSETRVVVEEPQPVAAAQVNQSYSSGQEGLNARYVVENSRENETTEPQGGSEWKSRETHAEENEIVITREAPVADRPKAHIQRNAEVYREQEAVHEHKKSTLPPQDTTTHHHRHHETPTTTAENTFSVGHQPSNPFADFNKSGAVTGNSSQAIHENPRESYSTLGQNPYNNQSNRTSENSFGQFGASGIKYSIPERKNERLPTFPLQGDDSISEDYKSSDKSRLLEVNTISDHESKAKSFVTGEDSSMHRTSAANRGLGSNANTFVEGDATTHVHIIQPVQVQVKRESVVQEKPVSKRPSTIEQVPLGQSQQQQEAYDTIREDNSLEQPLLGNKTTNSQTNKPKPDLNLNRPQAKGCCAALCAIFTGGK